MKRRLYQILEVAREGDRVSRVFDISILGLIALNVLALTLDTVEAIHVRIGNGLEIFELVSVIIFTVEYLVRMWTCTEDPEHSKPFSGRVRYGMKFFLLVDLFAILPFYLPFLIPGLDLRFIRSVRLMRIFRVLKIGRYSRTIQTFGRVLKAKTPELVMVGFVLIILLVLSSSMLYYAEHAAQPKAFSSIPATMWWAVATLTTVGYGDVYPVTPWGKFLAAFVAILGIGMFAIPAGILSSGFSEEFKSSRNPKN